MTDLRLQMGPVSLTRAGEYRMGSSWRVVSENGRPCCDRYHSTPEAAAKCWGKATAHNSEVVAA